MPSQGIAGFMIGGYGAAGGDSCSWQIEIKPWR
jgi:hypothetical protein